VSLARLGVLCSINGSRLSNNNRRREKVTLKHRHVPTRSARDDWERAAAGHELIATPHQSCDTIHWHDQELSRRVQGAEIAGALNTFRSFRADGAAGVRRAIGTELFERAFRSGLSACSA
jgi:hypothetical protein